MSTRERLLDAAAELTADQGWQAVTMAALGRAAGVSRQSVYNEFGSRDGVAEALVSREVERFLAVVDAQIAAGGSPAESATRAADAVFRLAGRNPVVRAAVSAAGGQPSGLLPLLTSESAPLIDAAVTRVSAALVARFPDLGGAGHLPDAVTAIVRLVISCVVSGGRTPDMGFICGRLLGPAPSQGTG